MQGLRGLAGAPGLEPGRPGLKGRLLDRFAFALVVAQARLELARSALRGRVLGSLHSAPLWGRRKESNPQSHAYETRLNASSPRRVDPSMIEAASRG